VAKRLLIIFAAITLLSFFGIIAGIVCNRAVISANNGRMPIVPIAAHQDIMRAFCKANPHYIIADEETRHVWLADRYNVSAKYNELNGDILISYWSIGDFLIRLGDLFLNLGFILMLGCVLLLIFTGKNPKPRKEP